MATNTQKLKRPAVETPDGIPSPKRWCEDGVFSPILQDLQDALNTCLSDEKNLNSTLEVIYTSLAKHSIFFNETKALIFKEDGTIREYHFANAIVELAELAAPSEPQPT